MSKNSEKLAAFTKYCQENPDQRFMQALRNFLDVGYVLTTDHIYPKDLREELSLHDTFYDE